MDLIIYVCFSNSILSVGISDSGSLLVELSTVNIINPTEGETNVTAAASLVKTVIKETNPPVNDGYRHYLHVHLNHSLQVYYICMF